MILLITASTVRCLKKQDGRFFSSRHDERAAGLPRVMSVAEKYGGMAEFTAVGNEFRSEVELRMQDG